MFGYLLRLVGKHICFFKVTGLEPLLHNAFHTGHPGMGPKPHFQSLLSHKSKVLQIVMTVHGRWGDNIPKQRNRLAIAISALIVQEMFQVVRVKHSLHYRTETLLAK